MLDTSKIYTSNNYGKFKVTNYINSKNVEIEFIATGYKAKARVDNIIIGNTKDLLVPSVYGVGFLGDGQYKSSHTGYQCWRSMLNRCYDEKRLERFQTYRGCTVCEGWHNFQNFAVWFDENYIEGCQLDKDIKEIGNREYSPSTCLFVSAAENTIRAHAKSYHLKSPASVLTSIFNMAEFCRENDLNHPAMIQVAKGKRNQHKGWTKPR